MGFEQLAALKQQLAQQARPETTRRKDPKAPRPKRVPEKSPVDPVVHSISKLQRRFPKAFPKNPNPKLPLKVGILDDLLTHATELGLSEKEVRDAMKTWCRGSRYWCSVVEGAARVDLDGVAVGAVSVHDAGRAKLLEERRKARAESKAKAEGAA